MGLFKTLFNIAVLPVAITADVLTMGAKVAAGEKSFTREQVEKIDDEMED